VRRWHDNACAVPAVKQALRGCRQEFGGRGADCVQGGDQRGVQQGERRGGVAGADQGDRHRFPPSRRCGWHPPVLRATSARGRTAHAAASGPGHPSRTAGILLPRISTLVPALRSSGTLGVAVCALRIAVLRAEPQPALGRGVKSQTKSQRSPAPGAIRPRPASITAGRGHIGRRPALSRDWGCAPYKRGVTGSIPVAPTRFPQADGCLAPLLHDLGRSERGKSRAKRGDCARTAPRRRSDGPAVQLTLTIG
jgi:hypothetical protein